MRPTRWRDRARLRRPGLISLPERKHRMSLEEIEARHPELISTLAGHPGIGFVMVRSDGDGAIVLGAGGRRRLHDDQSAGAIRWRFRA